jgi:hypothetical protein
MFDKPIIVNHSHALSYVVTSTKYLGSLFWLVLSYRRSNTGENPTLMGYERPVFSVHNTKKCRVNIDITPYILNLGIIWR